MLRSSLTETAKWFGVEAVGVREVQIARILKMAAVRAPNIDFANAWYVPAELVAALSVAIARARKPGRRGDLSLKPKTPWLRLVKSSIRCNDVTVLTNHVGLPNDVTV